MAKEAVPDEEGVPVIVYITEPFPLAKLPLFKVAVKPVTPVEEIVCAAYAPPFPVE
jgi:hypothetical protein